MTSSRFSKLAASVAFATVLLTAGSVLQAATFKDNGFPVQHVMLISIDGLHQEDLDRMIKSNPASALSSLANRGKVFSNAMVPVPSDSFPGLLALVTGGTPKSTGVMYDDAWDASLSEPGSDCSKTGTEFVYDEGADKNPDALDAGGGMDEAKLPRDPKNGCAPVYPHQFLRVNTIFEAVKAAGGTTAWADKHPAYDLVQGPSGKGVDDLFVPEINADETTGSTAKTEAYDDTKVAALLNEIAGHDHAGAGSPGVPTLFGMNFQAVSVTQKLKGAGYLDAAATPSVDLAHAIQHTDESIGKLVAALKAANLADNTLIVITAKHGQSPIDPTLSKIVDKKALNKAIEAAAPGGVGQITEDDAAYVFLNDHKDAAAVAKALEAAADTFSIAKVYQGAELLAFFNDANTDTRAPDLMIQPKDGVIFTKTSATKIAEHGGAAKADRHVGLLVTGPGIASGVVSDDVSTTAVAPTIMTALGLDPTLLQSVKAESTKALPHLN